MDKETLLAIESMLDLKLEPLKNNIEAVKTDLSAVKVHVESINNRLFKIEERQIKLESKLDRVLAACNEAQHASA